MLKLTLVTLLIAGLGSLTGCAVAQSPVGNGLLFTSIEGPIAAAAAVDSSKKGKACAQNVLGIVATGDASIDSAKKVGAITKVSSIDHTSFTVLMIYSEFCTIVRGS